MCLNCGGRTVGGNVVATLEPLLSPPRPPLPQQQKPLAALPLPAVDRFLLALEGSIESPTRSELRGGREGARAGQDVTTDAAAATTTQFKALGTVSSWLIDQLAISLRDTEEEKHPREGQAIDETHRAEECAEKVNPWAQNKGKKTPTALIQVQHRRTWRS